MLRAGISTLRESLNSDNSRYTVSRWLKKPKAFAMGLCIAIILAGVSYIIISPLLGVISRTFKCYTDLINPLIFLIPVTYTLENLRIAIQFMNYWEVLIRTLIFAGGIALLQVLIGSMVGYGFARFKIPGQTIMFAVLVSTIVIPVHSYMIPMFLQFRFFGAFGVEFNLIGTYMPVILLTLGGVGLRSGLFIFIFRQFFRGLPKEIEEAALIDGAGIFRTFFRVMIPNSIPPIITVLLFAFVWQYNDELYSTMLMPNVMFVGVAMEQIMWQFTHFLGGGNFGRVTLAMYAGVTLAITPVLIIYFLLQRHFIEGIERSGIVG